MALSSWHCDDCFYSVYVLLICSKYFLSAAGFFIYTKFTTLLHVTITLTLRSRGWFWENIRSRGDFELLRRGKTQARRRRKFFEVFLRQNKNFVQKMILPETKTGDCIVNRAVSISKDLDISLCCKLVKVKFCSEILFRIFVGHSNFECNLHSNFECKFTFEIRMSSIMDVGIRKKKVWLWEGINSYQGYWC